METKQGFEIYLNHITLSERFRHRETFENYKHEAVTMLQCHSKYFYEDDLLEKVKNDSIVQSAASGKPVTMEHVKATFPDRYVQVGHGKKKEKDKDFTKKWCDVWDEDFCVQPHHLNYELFFCYKLRSIALLEIDDFLDYQMEMHYSNDPKKIIRFLQLALRGKHWEKLLEPSYIQTVNEWITEKEKQTTLSGSEPFIKTKGKPKRERGDKTTKLSQAQTALLIHYLKEDNIWIFQCS